MIVLLGFKKSTNLKGVDAIKQLFLRKKIQIQVAFPAFKNACLLNPRSGPGWDRHLLNSTASRGQYVVKCVLNPRYLSLCRKGRGGAGFQLTDTLIIGHHN